MSDLNEASLCGRLGKDPQSRAMQNGDSVVSFSIATADRWNDRQTGERREATEWHTIVIFNEALGKVAMAHLRKGSQVLIKGKLQTRKWKDQAGADRYTTEIVLGKFGGFLQLVGGRDQGGEGAAGGDAGNVPQAGPADIDDEIPF